MKLLLPFYVGAKRLELSTPCTPCKCASQLRHAPNLICSVGDYLLSKTVAKVLLFFILTKFFSKKVSWKTENRGQQPILQSNISHQIIQ